MGLTSTNRLLYAYVQVSQLIDLLLETENLSTERNLGEESSFLLGTTLMEEAALSQLSRSAAGGTTRAATALATTMGTALQHHEGGQQRHRLLQVGRDHTDF